VGTIETLWVKRAHRGAMDETTVATFVAGRGIEGNADQGCWRPVSLLSADRWARVAAEVGHEVDPIVRRANVLLSGVDLVASRRRVLALGDDVRLRITVETRPCRLMDMLVPGLQSALDADWGGGASAQVLVGGTVRTGDEAVWVDDPDGDATEDRANVSRSGAHSSVG
jgi:MOSC domain-containing protein YiiM